MILTCFPMKNLTNMKVLVISTAFIFSALCSFGQNQAAQSGRSWTTNPFDQKVFIENKGQFDACLPGQEKANDGKGKILFSASQEGINMYWNVKGLTYRVTEHYLSEEVKA